MAQLLYSSSYKKPGVYIGQIIEPSGDSIATAARIPCMIGKGSRYAQASNSAVVRAYVYEEELDDISSSSPYTATLKHPALKDQSRAELVRKSDGYVIPEVKWSFGDDSQSIIISEDVYIADDEYTLSYQSTDRTVLDPTPVLDIISVGSCGSSISTSNFVENRDYFIAMSLEGLKEKDGEIEVETDKLDFDQRYESASLYPVSNSDKTWLSVDAIKYNGFDNLDLNFVAKFPFVGGSSKSYVKVNCDNYSGEDVTYNFTASVNTEETEITSITLTDATLGVTVEVTEEGVDTEIGETGITVNISSFASVIDEDSVVITIAKATDKIVLTDEAEGLVIEINEEGKFFPVGEGSLSKLLVAINSFADVTEDETVKVTVVAGKIFPTAKDNRKVNIKITAKESEGEDAVYTVYYASNTPEGGFGTVKSVGDRIILPGNIILKINSELDIDDQFVFELINNNVIDWNLTLKVSPYFRADSVYRDVNGTKTGVAGSYYVILAGIPIAEPTTDSSVTIEWIPDTSYVKVSNSDGTKPQNFSISYEYAGNEPNPGDTYYLTTKHIRPADMFNKVIFISSRAEGEMLLAPSTSKNDLYAANEIAWDEIGARAGYQIAYIQIKDSDDDGVLSSADVQAAIDALATSKKITDFTLLGNFEYIGKLLAANELGNDPFEARENEIWVGAPSGTPVGDINTEGSLIYIGQSVLKIYGNENPAHGTRILVGATEATKKITLEGNIEQTLKFDGSFVAWGLACHRSRMRTAASIMRETLTAFDSIQTYDDVTDIKLGQNQIVYFAKKSAGVYSCEEDFTTDKYSFEFSLEQITSQRLQVVRDIRAYMDESLIGYTPDTPAGGVTTIVSFLVRGLRAKITEGVIAPYQNEDGSMREIDPSKDIFVTIVKDNPTQYQFGYGFYTKKVMKQLFGSYVVDKNFVDTGLGN